MFHESVHKFGILMLFFFVWQLWKIIFQVIHQKRITLWFFWFNLIWFFSIFNQCLVGNWRLIWPCFVSYVLFFRLHHTTFLFNRLAPYWIHFFIKGNSICVFLRLKEFEHVLKIRVVFLEIFKFHSSFFLFFLLNLQFKGLSLVMGFLFVRFIRIFSESLYEAHNLLFYYFNWQWNKLNIIDLKQII